MMLVVLLQLGNRREIFRLSVGKIVAGHYRNCLTFAHTLSEFRPNATHNSSHQRHQWSFAIRVGLDDSRCLLATCVAGCALANCFDLDASSLSLLGSKCKCRLSGRSVVLLI